MNWPFNPMGGDIGDSTPIPATLFTHTGKEVLLGGQHFADCNSAMAAAHVASCLNAARVPTKLTMEDFSDR